MHPQTQTHAYTYTSIHVQIHTPEKINTHMFRNTKVTTKNFYVIFSFSPSETNEDVGIQNCGEISYLSDIL